MKLTYDNGRKEVLVAEFTTYSELIKALDDYIKSHNLHVDYYRWVGLTDHSMMIDYGSHYQFFYIDESFQTIMKLEEDEKSRSNPRVPEKKKSFWSKLFKKES